MKMEEVSSLKGVEHSLCDIGLARDMLIIVDSLIAVFLKPEAFGYTHS